jgi:phosphoribosylamine--glycine ligase
MNILLLGSGGREHALAWKISQSYHCAKLFIAPRNAGTATLGTNISISINDFSSIKNFCIKNSINIVVVGPEEPLVNGIYDFLREEILLKNVIIIAPSQAAAQLEGSKSFSKKFMQRHNIPTAGYAEFTKENFEEGKKYIANHSLPVVLKADGLAAGKGVIIAATHAESKKCFEEMIVHRQFGNASSKVVIEEFLSGIEVSVFVLTDGKNYQIIGHAKDYKRIGEGDTGLNTGGMGCVTPVLFADEVFMQKVETKIIQPTIAGLEKENLISPNCKIISIDCVGGVAKFPLIVRNSKSDYAKLFHDEIQKEFEDCKSIHSFIPFSDNYSFTKYGALNISFVNKAIVPGGYSLPNVHSSNDVHIDLNRIEKLTDALMNIVKKEN